MNATENDHTTEHLCSFLVLLVREHHKRTHTQQISSIHSRVQSPTLKTCLDFCSSFTLEKPAALAFFSAALTLCACEGWHGQKRVSVCM